MNLNDIFPNEFLVDARCVYLRDNTWRLTVLVNRDGKEGRFFVDFIGNVPLDIVVGILQKAMSRDTPKLSN